MVAPVEVSGTQDVLEVQESDCAGDGSGVHWRGHFDSMILS